MQPTATSSLSLFLRSSCHHGRERNKELRAPQLRSVPIMHARACRRTTRAQPPSTHWPVSSGVMPASSRYPHGDAMPSMFGVCCDAPGARTRSVRRWDVHARADSFRVHARQMASSLGKHRCRPPALPSVLPFRHPCFRGPTEGTTLAAQVARSFFAFYFFLFYFTDIYYILISIYYLSLFYHSFLSNRFLYLFLIPFYSFFYSIFSFSFISNFSRFFFIFFLFTFLLLICVSFELINISFLSFCVLFFSSDIS
jgi:hypothetical protein